MAKPDWTLPEEVVDNLKQEPIILEGFDLVS